MIDQDILAIKDRAWESLQRIPGVHAVGIGRKVVRGISTGETAIIAFVANKLERSELEPSDVVPPVIETIPTDVVEMHMPRLTQGTPVIPLTQTVAATASGATIEFTTTIDPPPLGLVIIISVALTGPGSVGGPKITENFCYTSFTNGRNPLSVILFKLAIVLSQSDPKEFASHFDGHVLFGTTTLAIQADPGFVAKVSCTILASDATKYSGDYLRGGIRIQADLQPVELGTLGLLATTIPTAANPNGTVVAITNQHVVESKTRVATTLLASLLTSPTRIVMSTLTVAPSPPLPLTANSVTVVSLFLKQNVIGVALYVAQPTDSLEIIANGVAQAITKAAIPGISATATGRTVNLIGPFNPSSIVCQTMGPFVSESSGNLKVSVVKSAPFAFVLTFSDRIAGFEHGVFVNITPGGAAPTISAFVNTLGLNASAIAAEVSKAVHLISPGVLANAPIGASVEINGAALVECTVLSEVRVGQPTNCFTWPCSDSIGRVVDSREDVDAALIQLDPGLKYKLQIEGIGVVNGVTPPFIDVAVQKRGFVTGVTTGTITALATSGIILTGEFPTFRRFYKNAIVVTSNTSDDGGITVRPFMGSGDSGSALVTGGAAPVQVVGLLFGGGDDSMGLATPIVDVMAAFPKLGLSFAVVPGRDPQAVQTVPANASHFEALPERTLGVNDPRVAAGRARSAGFTSHLHSAEREIAATSVGQEFANFIKQHGGEAQALVSQNRRVGAIWQRNGGPEFLNRVLMIICNRGQRLPKHIGGKPFAECIANIQRVLLRYASPSFSAGLKRYVPYIETWAGMTYTELVTTFEDLPGRRHHAS